MKHFLIFLVFFIAFSPKLNVHSHSNALKYLKNGNLWRLLAPQQREIETFVHEFFVENLIQHNFCSKFFLNKSLFFVTFCPKRTPTRHSNSICKITNSFLNTHTQIECSALWYRFRSQYRYLCFSHVRVSLICWLFLLYWRNSLPISGGS